jgi:hypothetical protein
MDDLSTHMFQYETDFYQKRITFRLWAEGRGHEKGTLRSLGDE